LEYFVILIGIIVGTQLVRAYRRRKLTAQRVAALTTNTEAEKPNEPHPSELAADASITARLHRLESGFAPFASASAHPRELAVHAQFKDAARLLADPSVPLGIVMEYVRGANWALSCVALAALEQRADRGQVLAQTIAHFDQLAPWAMYFALAYFLGVDPAPPVGAPVVAAKDWWRDNPVVVLIFQDYFARCAERGDTAEFGPALHAPTASPHATIRSFLERVNHPLATALVIELDSIKMTSINREFLTSFGRFWSDQEEPETLVEPNSWRLSLAAAEASLHHTPMRSLLVSGEQLVGKTSFLRLLAKRLAPQGWSVFEASGADVMAGQIWFGQLEGRIRQVIDELTAAKKLIWYIPDLLQLARSGTHQGQSASILDQILPAIVAGRLVIWTEANPTSAARLNQTRPTLRGILEVIRLEPQSEADTSLLARAVVAGLADELKVTIHPDCAAVALSSARQYLSATSFPGSALLLIRLAASRADKDAEISPHAVLEVLSQLTGLPVSILDSKERIDLAALRTFFASRVIGQDEAVTTVVERVAMLKAGLNDPGRPIGILLFAGPTGTGKTELAKTVAEYLFGSVDRMIRLDMSEFQTADDIFKILGDAASGQADTLISRVRKQPFSVVLLDEFEKSHSRIWDLFLQVFDEGRLTDSLGQVADFRHCLIILTTNLGATSHHGSGLGFAPPAAGFASEQVMRAISQTYRPEFQNRLDKVIVFRPLTRDLMRVILRKELDRVLERRGLKDRAWAVEWEASALEFLLEKGFSPEMGARPLKRAIDQYVIAPLAATIVERRFPEGDQFVFFRSDGRLIKAEFVDPDSDAPSTYMPPDSEGGGRPPALASMILAPKGTSAEFDALAAHSESIDQLLASPEWEDLKRRLSEEMAAADFWTRPERYERLARLALMDRVAAANGTAAALRARLARRSGRTSRYSRELVSRLALQLYLIEQGTQDVFEAAPVEVAIAVEPALEASGDGRAAAAWCRQLLAMYRAWSNSRHMQMTEINCGASRDLPLLLVSGFGAHRVLSRECGLHVLELAEGGDGASRVTARLRLAISPLGDVPAAKLPSALIAAFEKAPPPITVIRRYRREPAPLVRSANGSWRSGRLDLVLRGDFDLLAIQET
jgi:ATP-dependent Clp protease ATP-binding subunit ClpC